VVESKSVSESLSVLTVDEAEVVTENVPSLLHFLVMFILFVVSIDELLESSRDVLIVAMDKLLHWVETGLGQVMLGSRPGEVAACEAYRECRQKNDYLSGGFSARLIATPQCGVSLKTFRAYHPIEYK